MIWLPWNDGPTDHRGKGIRVSPPLVQGCDILYILYIFFITSLATPVGLHLGEEMKAFITNSTDFEVIGIGVEMWNTMPDACSSAKSFSAYF